MVPSKGCRKCRVSSLERGLCGIEILSDVYGNVGHVVAMCPSSCYQGAAPVVCDQFQVECLFLTRSQKTFHKG